MAISCSVATHLLAIIAVTFRLAAVNATERPPRAGETPDAAKREPAAVGPAASTEPASASTSASTTTGATADGANSSKKTVKQPPRRRSVQMTVDGMRPSAPPAVYVPTLTPPPSASALPSYAPSLSNSAAMPTPGMPAPSTIRTPDRPVFINSCDAGGCISTDGARYNGGVGATLIGPQGRLCNRNGATVQC